jgi:hypothetical protein
MYLGTFFPALIFFQLLVIKTRDPELDPDPQLEKKAGLGSVSGSALNQCGSANLGKKHSHNCDSVHKK